MRRDRLDRRGRRHVTCRRDMATRAGKGLIHVSDVHVTFSSASSQVLYLLTLTFTRPRGLWNTRFSVEVRDADLSIISIHRIECTSRQDDVKCLMEQTIYKEL